MIPPPSQYIEKGLERILGPKCFSWSSVRHASRPHWPKSLQYRRSSECEPALR